jgi:hypothetical protein
MSRWWRELYRILGTRLLMSTSFHPQTDRQTEQANQNIGQIFQTMVRHDQKDWVDHVNMTEFVINVSILETTKYIPFELNGGYMPSTIKELHTDEVIPKGIKAFMDQALQNLTEVHDAIIKAWVVQTSYANMCQREEATILQGNLVYLLTKNLNLPKGRARKLCPKYVGPYKVIKADPASSTCTLELPVALQELRIIPKFHISLLKPYIASSDTMFLNRLHTEPYDFGAPDDQEWFVDKIMGHQWHKGSRLQNLKFEVRWSLGDTTWETYESCKDLEALDHYLEVHGIKCPAQLTRLW